MVISLHGGGGNVRQHRVSSGTDAAADRYAYIAVFPNGSGRLGDRLLTWNAGNCCGYAQHQNVDDVTFISRLIDDLQRRTAMDPRRIYVAGHSNGGMMAHTVWATPCRTGLPPSRQLPVRTFPRPMPVRAQSRYSISTVSMIRAPSTTAGWGRHFRSP